MSDTLLQKLIKVQKELKAPKNQFNAFGKYHYRSCEDILSAAKPLCVDNNLLLTVSDEIVMLGNRFYVKATAKVVDGENEIVVTASAREEETKKGMDASQITGAASSYARKYALNGLFAIDDTADADTMDNSKKDNQHSKPENKATAPPANKPVTNNDSVAKNLLLKKIQDKAKKAELSGKDMVGIINFKYHQPNSTGLNIEQCGDLFKNFDKYLDEYITAGAAS